jgi:UDP-glucose 4-epimerase
MNLFEGKVVAITGGTGSLGKVLTRRLLSGTAGTPRKVIVFSRDEAKQHYMRLEYQHKKNVTDEVIYDNFRRILEFRIGDVRDYHAVCGLLRGVDVVVNAAALKQVPSCEYFPYEAVQTNVTGPENLIRAIRENELPIQTVVGVSTDKACKPVNVMGMTKAVQERVFISANLTLPDTRFVCVRYGNVLASRGSVIPLFHEQILAGGPVTITTEDMTRFLLPLERGVDTIFAAIAGAHAGETYIPRVPAARIVDVARALVGQRKVKIEVTGIRPGEKIHETLVSEEEAARTVIRGEYYAILPMLPEIAKRDPREQILGREYSSGTDLLTAEQTAAMLKEHELLLEQLNLAEAGEVLR